MQLGVGNNVIPVTRSACVYRFVKSLQAVGEPFEPLLSEAGIPAEILEYPEAVIPLKSAFKFGELACRKLDTEHLALELGMEMSLRDFGPYGRQLLESVTVYEYICKGIELSNTLVTGQRFWLSRHGNEFRLNLSTAGEPNLGSYQSHLDSVAISISVLRKAVLPRWSPREISFAWQSRENLPESEIFDGSSIVQTAGITYLTIPESLMVMRFAGHRLDWPTTPGSQDRRALPDTLDHLVQHQIEVLLSSRELDIDTVAESLTMNRRSLQRRLEKLGLTYSRLLAETRTRLAVRWLQESERSITDIGFALGYRDASNFTRAFGQKTGISPSSYRRISVGCYGDTKNLYH